MWKIDTTKDTMLAIMKPYQHGIISMMIEKKTGLITSEIHAALEFEGYIVSRASVINFCKTLAAHDIVSFEERTGKGGYHRVYSALMSWESIIEYMHMKVLAKMKAAFPDSGYLQDTVGLLSK